MGTVVTEWAMPYLAWGSMLYTVEAIKQLVDTLNKHSRRQLLAAEHKHELVQACLIVTFGQIEKYILNSV